MKKRKKKKTKMFRIPKKRLFYCGYAFNDIDLSGFNNH